MMMWGYPATWSWGGMAFMTISVVFWLVVLGIFLLLLARWLGLTNGGGASSVATPSAQHILEERYARGEIDAETFQRMREDLARRRSKVR